MFSQIQSSGIRLTIIIQNGKPVLETSATGMTAASIMAARTDRLEASQTAAFLKEGAAYIAAELDREQVYGLKTYNAEFYGKVGPEGNHVEITESEFTNGTTPIGFNLS